MGRLFSLSGVIQDAVSSTGNGTVFDVHGMNTIGVEISGTFVGTLTFQGRVANGTWYAIQAENINNGAISTTATAVGLFRIPAAGIDEFRVPVAWSSGTSVTVTISVTVAASGGTLADVDIVVGEQVDIGDISKGTQTNDVKVTLDSEAVVLGVGSAAIGKLAANTGVDIGDVDVTSVPGALQGPGNPTVDSYSSAVVNLAASTADQELVATPGSGKQIWVYGVFMMADTAAGTVAFQDEDNAALSGVMAVSDEGGWVLPMSGNFAMPWMKVPTNKALEVDTGACTVDGILTYAIVDVS